MDIDLKQRLIGAIVIFSLLIIFLPMVFEQNDSEEKLEQLLTAPILQSDNNNKEIFSNKSSKNLSEPVEELEDKNGLEQQFIFSNNINKGNQQEKSNKTSKHYKSSESVLTDNINQEPESMDNASALLESKKKLKDQTENKKNQNTEDLKLLQNLKKDHNNKSAKTIKYTIPNSLTKTEVYAIKINSSDNGKSQKKIKDLLLSLGFPAYTIQTNGDNAVYVGPDYELKYIKELANRLLEETEFQPEIITQNNKLS